MWQFEEAEDVLGMMLRGHRIRRPGIVAGYPCLTDLDPHGPGGAQPGRGGGEDSEEEEPEAEHGSVRWEDDRPRNPNFTRGDITLSCRSTAEVMKG